MKGKADNAVLMATLMRTSGLAVDLSAKTGEGLPRRIKILNWGENPNARGKRIFVGPKLVQALNAPANPFRKIPLDFEHNTLPGTPAYLESKEPRLIAGFAETSVVEGQGVFITMLNWTPDGLQHAANFCDVSAAAVPDKEGNVILIPSVALCRTGAVEGMDFKEVPLSVSADLAAVLSKDDRPVAPTTTEVQDLNWKQMIAEALGMDPECGDEELKQALKGALAKPDPTALNAQIGTAIDTALKPLADQVTALNAAGEAFKAELVKRDKADVLAQAQRDGKVVALNADAVGKLSVDDLKAHVQALPVTVPLSARTPETMAPDAAAGGVTEAQRAIALNCGLDPEAVFKTR